MSREDLLRELLLWHRRRLTRAMIGLPSKLLGDGKFLSQDDLAEAAGVSIGVIQRLESGKARPEPWVLDRVATALRMYPDERRVLYELALGHPPPEEAFTSQPDPRLAGYIDRVNGPAMVMDATYNLLGCNDLARQWLGGLCRDPQANLARWVLLHPHAPHVVVNWRRVAEPVVGRLRLLTARFPDDEAIAALLADAVTNPLVTDIIDTDGGQFYQPMAREVLLRPPGRTDPAQSGDERHHVTAQLVTLDSPRPNDGRRVVVVVFDDPHEPRPVNGREVCDGCR